jgi:hypothetical protein
MQTSPILQENWIEEDGKTQVYVGKGDGARMKATRSWAENGRKKKTSGVHIRTKTARCRVMAVTAAQSLIRQQTRVTLQERNIGSRTVIETQEYQHLLEQNREMLASTGSRHDLAIKHEIEIGSRYQDWDVTMQARNYVDEKYQIPRGLLFSVVSMKYAEDDVTIDLRFDLLEVPDAETITKYEYMLIDAAEKFGGETPGWEIEIK